MKNTKKIIIIVVSAILVLTIMGVGTVLGARAIAKDYIRKETQTMAVNGNNGTSNGAEQNLVIPENKEQENENQGNENPENTNQDGQISLDEAKEIALSDAGLNSSDVTYTKDKLDYDDGISVYEIEFYTLSREYEYEIDSTTGAIHSKKAEALKNAKSAGDSSSDNNGNYIGLDQAKSIALKHAGFTESDVTFSKAKFEKDDGYMVYEVEFYKGRKEYEYKIDASDGTILKYDAE